MKEKLLQIQKELENSLKRKSESEFLQVHTKKKRRKSSFNLLNYCVEQYIRVMIIPLLSTSILVDLDSILFLWGDRLLMTDIAHNECISKSFSFSILFFSSMFDVCVICRMISPSDFVLTGMKWNLTWKSYARCWTALGCTTGICDVRQAYVTRVRIYMYVVLL